MMEGTMCRYFRCDVFRKLSLFLLIVALGLFAVPRIMVAQTTSTIEGAATDKQGLALAGAQVRAESSSLAVDRSVTTDSAGEYRL